MVIQEIKKLWFWQMVKHKVPKQLWDYGIVWVCESMLIASKSSFSLDERTPMEQVQVKLLTYLNILTLAFMIVGFGTKTMLGLVRTVLAGGLALHIKLETSCHIRYLWKQVM